MKSRLYEMVPWIRIYDDLQRIINRADKLADKIEGDEKLKNALKTWARSLHHVAEGLFEIVVIYIEKGASQ